MFEKFPLILQYNDTKMKTKEDILIALNHVINELDNYLSKIDDKSFIKSINKKWSIAQNIEHLTISNNITAFSITMPKIILQQLYGKKQRNDWNYDEVVWQYQLKLQSGAKAAFAFQPKLSLIKFRKPILLLWKNSCKNLVQAIQKLNEEDLDNYLIPHPIIGKITIRELLFFTIYHIQHHFTTIKNIV